jgi:hypothetical protein
VGCAWFAVVPPDVLAQVKRDREFIRRKVPRFGQVAYYIQVLVVLDETVEHVTGDVMRG